MERDEVRLLYNSPADGRPRHLSVAEQSQADCCRPILNNDKEVFQYA